MQSRTMHGLYSSGAGIQAGTFFFPLAFLIFIFLSECYVMPEISGYSGLIWLRHFT